MALVQCDGVSWSLNVWSCSLWSHAIQLYFCVCVCVRRRWRVRWFTQNSVVAGHPWSMNTKPFQMSLWSSWWIRASFTLFFLLFIFFPHASPIQEIDRKVSRDVSTFYSSLFLFPRKVKVLLFPLFQILFSYRLHILMITYNYRWLKKFRLFSTYINRRKP